MADQVLPVKRGQWVLQVIVSVLAVAVGVFVAGAAFAGVDNPLFGVVGVLCIVIFGSIGFASVRALMSPGLQLRSDAITYGTNTFPRSAIAGFKPVGMQATTHLRILFTADATLSPTVKLAQWAGKIGYYTPGNHIPIKGFDTGGKPLEDILNRWLTAA